MTLRIVDDFAAQWASNESAPDVFTYLQGYPTMSLSDKLEVLRIDQQNRWKTATPIVVEQYLEKLPELLVDSQSRLKLALGEFHARKLSGKPFDANEFWIRFPDVANERPPESFDRTTFVASFGDSEQFGRENAADGPPVSNDVLLTDQVSGAKFLGRYRLIRLLGSGGFGEVWLAEDAELQRRVAIKVPRLDRFAEPQDADVYLEEARTVARLDHSNIVPVYDVGRTEGGLIYVISKFIAGCTLADKIKHDRPSFGESAKLLGDIGRALDYAHQRHLIHRDVKPANILIEENSGTAFLADFGLAIREEHDSHDAQLAGTPAYMSPEQARGESHRLDGRSDIFSLGIVLYELLTGKRPFQGSTAVELLRAVISVDVLPPRKLNPAIPPALEFICLKALSKRAADRYPTASALIEDLLNWNQAKCQTPERAQIVPKSLRAFDSNDADFFLELLPGPRNSDGLPESIRFWKTHLEETEPHRTFPVGVLYGPSGCGKSSFVKAGLVPRLSRDVVAIYVEATSDDTEARILSGIRKRLPGINHSLSLAATLASYRHHRGRKLVVVIDQFEQWLNAHRSEEDSELVTALRQCDGETIQAVVMVRDDFWLGVSRFMNSLEIRMVEGENSRLIDLFDPTHARNVLAAFGAAFGCLPYPEEHKYSLEQEKFLDQAVMGLAEDGKVISVRLALFAEMFKGRQWTLATLAEVGGAAGIGATFLDETFSATKAPPGHRFHQQAARQVLKALLPETGTNIKGHMRSLEELLEVSGYARRPKDFADLMHLLDRETRLVTLTDPEGQVGSDSTTQVNQIGQQYFQLTHDYLVLSLKDWLGRKQRETRRGRAELLLEERAGAWNSTPDVRHLPSLFEFARICLFSHPKAWLPSERKMMQKATRFHATRTVIATIAIVLMALVSNELYGSFNARALRDRLVDANTDEVGAIVEKMSAYRRWVNPILRETFHRAEVDGADRKRMHCSLALLPFDHTQTDYVFERFLSAAPHEVPVIRDALKPYERTLRPKLWETIRSGDDGRRLRAAAALALYDPDNQAWSEQSPTVAKALVLENMLLMGQWTNIFRPVNHWLLPPLTEIYRDKRSETAAERSVATHILCDYAGDKPQTLANLLIDADDKQFPLVFAKFEKQGDSGIAALTNELDGSNVAGESIDAAQVHAKRQANAAVALLRLNRPEVVWPLLQHSPDPTLRSYLIERIGLLGVSPQIVIDRLKVEPDITVQRALLLCLAGCDPDSHAACVTATTPELKYIYLTAADPGLHSASECVLRRWKQGSWLKQANAELSIDSRQGEDRLRTIKTALATQSPRSPMWYVNRQGQTLIIVPGPVEFRMGSPESEVGRKTDERQHQRRIGRSFALSAHHVTLEQFQRFDPNYRPPGNPSRGDDYPVVGPAWYRAAAYLNWLSEQEGIPRDQWCYRPNSNGDYADGMTIAENYLSLSGYRMPTEAEYEYAARAGATTTRHYGESDELFKHYGWYLVNAYSYHQPVGRLRPNDLGLFDSLGNIFTWCQEPYQPYPDSTDCIDDIEGTLEVNSVQPRIMRGSAFDRREIYSRVSGRRSVGPSGSGEVGGFRVARTITAPALTEPGEPKSLVEMILSAGEHQLAALCRRFELEEQHGYEVLVNEVKRSLTDDSTAEAKETFAKRKANAAVVLLKLNHPEHVWALLRHSADPRVRSYFIHRVRAVGVDPRFIADRIPQEPDVSVRRALILCVGEYRDTLDREVHDNLLPLLHELFLSDPDAGIHASSEWTLRQLGQEEWINRAKLALADDPAHDHARRLSSEIATVDLSGNAPVQWFTSRQGQTMAVVHGPVEFTMGSPESEPGRRDVDEVEHTRRIERSFCVSTELVTLGQFQKFNKNHTSPATFGVGNELPAVNVSWFDTAAYLNWLSNQDGIPQSEWCYVPNSEGKYEAGMTFAVNHLERQGYRLPTEGELEYVTRAGAATSRFFGESEELLRNYAWYGVNSNQQLALVGRLKPNDFGIFDAYGNVFTWCQDNYRRFPKGEIVVDTIDGPQIRSTEGRVARGGAFGFPALFLRSAHREYPDPTYRNIAYGFRFARTIPMKPVQSNGEGSTGTAIQ